MAATGSSAHCVPAEPTLPRTGGTLDPTFNATFNTGLNSTVTAVAVQPGGKIIAGGYFTSYNGTTRNRVARLNADGTLDPGFAPTGTGLDNAVTAVAVQPDGKIIIGGAFTSYNSSPAARRVARLGPGLIAQEITFAQPANTTLGAGRVTLSATGGGSGNPVVFTSTTAAVCTVTGSTVTLRSLGT